MQGKTKSQFKSNIKTMFGNIADDGFNTVFVHVRSHSDAMYDSDIFPWSVYCTGTEGNDPGFDPLEIMVSEAHSAGLKIEAWINPYRIKGTSNTSKIAKSSPAYKWLDTDKVIVLDNGIYYNPADEEVIELIVSGVEEVVSNYDVDGIHFDDYFYPTTSESFDKAYYNDYKAAGGKLSLASWRRQNVNTLIKEVYSSIKAINSSCRFGVSPAGNMDQNYNTLYCDVNTWVTSKGYVDYICPQIYFGFNNKSRPYLDVLSEFSSMITRSDVELIVGLAAYKAGAEDTYAGDNGK
ncbi:MAG: family 10 glycosylhydrolase, partial [Oscillospiraceae bacterium]|nr:family 10 glycosylhydrolase [Oscillospiraceae bacterium]